jgi:hypothetical protein
MSDPVVKPKIYFVSSSLNESGAVSCADEIGGETRSKAAVKAWRRRKQIEERQFTKSSRQKGSRP